MGMGSHEKTFGETDIWLTPRYILDALGEFDLDPAAAPDFHLWPTAKAHITLPDDGLVADWTNQRIWLNPPYSRNVIGRWMEKLSRHNGVALIFARTETSFFQDYIWSRADAALFLRGRLNFHRPDGKRSRRNAGAPSVLVAYGADNAECLHQCELDGRFIPIAPHAALFVFAKEIERYTEQTWIELVREIFKDLGGKASLQQIYQRIEDHPKTRGRMHWKAKVRQSVVLAGARRVGTAQYQLAI